MSNKAMAAIAIIFGIVMYYLAKHAETESITKLPGYAK